MLDEVYHLVQIPMVANYGNWRLKVHLRFHLLIRDEQIVRCVVLLVKASTA